MSERRDDPIGDDGEGRRRESREEDRFLADAIDDAPMPASEGARSVRTLLALVFIAVIVLFLVLYVSRPPGPDGELGGSASSEAGQSTSSATPPNVLGTRL
jgi:hypothetical protein